MQTSRTFVEYRFRPGLEWDVFLHILRQISQISRWRIPDSGQIRLSIGKARRGRREVRLAISRTGDRRLWNICPLRKRRRAERGHDYELQQCLHVRLQRHYSN
jgi:hypothetical protein